MNKFTRRASALALAASMALGSLSPALAQNIGIDTAACQTNLVDFGFFNGVATTEDQAFEALQAFRYKYGETSSQGDHIRYEVYYNLTEGFRDFVEVFEQRLKEHEGLLAGRFELFFSALNGGGNWWSVITDAVPALAGVLDSFGQWSLAAVPRLLTSMATSPATAQTQAEHRARLQNATLEGRKLLLVAHSQGNLFVNAAYDYAVTLAPSASVKVVHIAPASPTLRGPHVLADKDVVINGLRVTGSIPPITDTIPPIVNRTPGINGEKDFMGHGLLAIYLHPEHTTWPKIDGYIKSAFASLVAPTSQAKSGFFTTTLTWDGAGDIDLHTFEPGNSHVFFDSPRGLSGYLDVDNTVGVGPEHYYASCDTTQLREGSYRVALANYGRAEGRNATVQVATAADGVLGTKTVTMGAATKWNPSVNVFEVLVAKDPRTGKLRATLGS